MIRLASVLDTRHVMPLVAEAWSHSRGYADLPVVESMLRRTVHDYLASDATAVWLSVRGGDVCGLLAASIGPLQIASGLASTDDCFYVRPSAGLSTDAARMVEKYKAWATKRHARIISLSVSSGNAAAERLIAGRGFKRVGGNFILSPV